MYTSKKCLISFFNEKPKTGLIWNYPVTLEIMFLFSIFAIVFLSQQYSPCVRNCWKRRKSPSLSNNIQRCCLIKCTWHCQNSLSWTNYENMFGDNYVNHCAIVFMYRIERSCFYFWIITNDNIFWRMFNHCFNRWTSSLRKEARKINVLQSNHR